MGLLLSYPLCSVVSMRWLSVHSSTIGDGVVLSQALPLLFPPVKLGLLSNNHISRIPGESGRKEGREGEGEGGKERGGRERVREVGKERGREVGKERG